METKFNSQICTTREESKRLLALGLKKETADMYYSYDIICAKPYYKVMEFMNGCVPEDIFPAWSLHRLIEMTHKNTIDNNAVVLSRNQTYDQLIGRIARQIEEGYFNKDYLEE